MSKPSEKMTAADFRRQFCDDKGVKESKPSQSGRVASTGAGRKLVAVEIEVNGNKEIHYLFEGSDLLQWWLDQGATLKK